MLEQDASKANDVDAIFYLARRTGAVERPAEHLHRSSSSRSFTGTARLPSGEMLSSAPQQPEVVTNNIIFWSNGFTVDDGPSRRLDAPANVFEDPVVIRNNLEKYVRYAATLYQYLSGIGLGEEANELENYFVESRVPWVVTGGGLPMFLNQEVVLVADLVDGSASRFPCIVQSFQALSINGPSFDENMKKFFGGGYSEIEKEYSCDLSKLCKFVAFNMKAYRFLKLVGLQAAASRLKDKINSIRPHEVVVGDTVCQFVDGYFDPTNLIKHKYIMFRRSMYCLAVYGFDVSPYLPSADSIELVCAASGPSTSSALSSNSTELLPAASGPSAYPATGPIVSTVSGSSHSTALDISPLASSVSLTSMEATSISSPMGEAEQPFSYVLLQSISQTGAH